MTNDSTALQPGGDPLARNAAIASLSSATSRMQVVCETYNSTGGDATSEVAVEQAIEQVLDSYSIYEGSLPRPGISRCPFTGEIVRLAIDTFGLDGPWWDCERPARPEQHLPDTFFALTGSVDFGDRTPHLPFLCKPGPALPYVVPRMLVAPTVKAVVSSIRIGQHRAYPIVYFAEDPPLDIPRANEWGLDHYAAEHASGERYSLRIHEDDLDYDFDLAFYIATGRLLWIAPGDTSLTLRSVVAGCPYLGLEGRKYPVGLRDGTVWNCLVEAS